MLQAVLDACAQHGVCCHRDVRYDPEGRHVMDLYVPAEVAADLAAKRAADTACTCSKDSACRQQVDAGTAAPVVFFTHGGLWASGEPWQYSWLSTRLAQVRLLA